ncbi:MAG: bifunctional ADP-dependent NAD(P)H-hydrate dehydratase/NAD(P)H-hydrate epimerase [Bacteroidetes bacterium]|nr:MAG: bifunctional ADP-dependent NAD(P)H-hydrate dehydratase/NAD(P)H-hydrate epimerase [Bacteroidota bacterium]
MQIFSAEQIRLWDKYTIEHEPILSIDLMERAASECLEWLNQHLFLDHSFTIFCGKGNNGGDGLAIARMLSLRKTPVTVYILEFGHKGTEDFQVNLARLHKTDVEIRFIQSEDNIRDIPPDDIIVDALFGCGLNRPLEGVTAILIDKINNSGNTVISIDIPSGLYVDKSSIGNPIVRASYTLSFQCYKLAFLMAENDAYFGQVYILDIGLHQGFPLTIENAMEMVDIDYARDLYRPRKKFSHKGNFGHALLVVGSKGKMGAALISAKGCLRSGVGLLSCHIPACGYSIIQNALPESMVFTDADENINTAFTEEITEFDVIGIGPGIGRDERTKELLETLCKHYKSPIVIDADALNIISSNSGMLNMIPPYSILTPHPKEFERLFGKSLNDFERVKMAMEQAKKIPCIVVLKGHYTFIAMPDGKSFFNGSGNPGMAKGGSGDALTGILTGILAQGYSAGEAALMGVFLHGLAGDLASQLFSEEAMLPSDLIECLGEAFKKIRDLK